MENSQSFEDAKKPENIENSALYPELQQKSVPEGREESNLDYIEQKVEGLAGIMSNVSEYVDSQQEVASEEAMELFDSWYERMDSSVLELSEDLSLYTVEGFFSADQKLNLIAQFAELSEIVKEVRLSEDVIGDSAVTFFVSTAREIRHVFEGVDIDGEQILSPEMQLEEMIYSIESGNAAIVSEIAEQVSLDPNSYMMLSEGFSVYQSRIEDTIEKYPKKSFGFSKFALMGILLLAAGCSSKNIDINAEVQLSMRATQSTEVGISQPESAVISKDATPVEEKAVQESIDPPEHFTPGQKRLLLHEMEPYHYLLEEMNITPESVLDRFAKDNMGFMESFNTMSYGGALTAYINRHDSEVRSSSEDGGEELERPIFSYERNEDYQSIFNEYSEIYENFSNMVHDGSDPMKYVWNYFRISGKGIPTPDNLRESDTKSVERVTEVVRRYRMAKSLQEAVNYLIHKYPEAGHAELRVDGRLGKSTYEFIRGFVSPAPWEFSRSPLYQYHNRSVDEFRRALFNQNPVKRDDVEVSPFFPEKFNEDIFHDFINQFIESSKIEGVSLDFKQPEGFGSPEISQYEEKLIQSFEKTCGSKFFLNIMDRGFEGDQSKYFESEFFAAYRQQKTWYINQFIELQKEYADSLKIEDESGRLKKKKELIAKAKKLYITGYKIDFGFYKNTKYNYDGLGTYPKRDPQACGRYPYIMNTMLGAPVKERISNSKDPDDKRLPWQPPATKQPSRYTYGKVESRYVAKADAHKFFSGLEEGIYVIGRGTDEYGHMLLLGPEPGRASVSRNMKEFLQTSSKAFFTDSFLKIGERPATDNLNKNFIIGQVTDDITMQKMLEGSFADADKQLMVLVDRDVLDLDRIDFSPTGEEIVKKYKGKLSSK